MGQYQIGRGVIAGSTFTDERGGFWAITEEFVSFTEKQTGISEIIRVRTVDSVLEKVSIYFSNKWSRGKIIIQFQTVNESVSERKTIVSRWLGSELCTVSSEVIISTVFTLKQFKFSQVFYNIISLVSEGKLSIWVSRGTFSSLVCLSSLQNQQKLFKFKKQETQSMSKKENLSVPKSISFNERPIPFCLFWKAIFLRNKRSRKEKAITFLLFRRNSISVHAFLLEACDWSRRREEFDFSLGDVMES